MTKFLLALRILALLWLGCLLTLCVWKSIAAIQAEKSGPGLDGSWGGFGGTNTNWHMTKAMAYMIMSALMAFTFAIVALVPLDPTRDSKETDQNMQAQPVTPAANRLPKPSAPEAPSQADPTTRPPQPLLHKE